MLLSKNIVQQDYIVRLEEEVVLGEDSIIQEVDQDQVLKRLTLLEKGREIGPLVATILLLNLRILDTKMNMSLWNRI